MDLIISKQLVDKIYEKRKAAALELEKQVRECYQQGEHRKIGQIIDQLVEMYNNSSNQLHVRNGGLIGLAGTAIALGVEVSPYMGAFIGPLLDCFVDPENRIRYFSAECLYNIAKVSKGEVLVYFNDIFDALSKLAADSELSVKNGAELLDRLLKDIVAESASVYIPLYPETEKVRHDRDDGAKGVLVSYSNTQSGDTSPAKKAFSLAHFIPLLRERIYVVSPFTRSYLVSWITVLDSVPELELISYLPEFLDGLLKYLSDPTEDVRIATETLLADFLREIHAVSGVRKQMEEKSKLGSERAESIRRIEPTFDKLPDLNVDSSERAVFLPENDDTPVYTTDSLGKEDSLFDVDDRDTGAWIPGQGVKIDYAAIVEILIHQLDGEHDEIQQSAALRWLAEFLTFSNDVLVPFTPRLIPAILPNLAHHVVMIQSVAVRTNKLLFNVIQSLPSPPETASRIAQPERQGSSRPLASPTSTATVSTSRQSTLGREGAKEPPSKETATFEPVPEAAPQPPPGHRSRGSIVEGSMIPRPVPAEATTSTIPNPNTSRPQSATSFNSQVGQTPQPPLTHSPSEETDPFDYQSTVNELTIQFLSEFEETRVAALKWLIMLHQKAPRKILAMDDGTFPALLKTLSDSSEEVIKHDLQLLAQISSSSEENYFKAFMMNLLELFSTDRRLLETRGSLIIRQLCLNLNTERIYRTFAEILEKEDDLEFASVIVQKLNMILITSPELADFRKRLKSLETRQDGQALFTTLYRSWCHNAVAVFSLCLLAQAYEHASNLLYIFADLEITVQMLVQVDKLVQLIESPVFTYIRLQLLEPERHPHLFKCLYGLMMILPQSSAFVSLRNRLNALNSAAFLHITPKSSTTAFATRSKIARDEIKWQELLQHFRTVQAKHEKARRHAMGNDAEIFDELPRLDQAGGGASNERVGRPSTTSRPPLRRKLTGDFPMNASAGSSQIPAPPPQPVIPARRAALSPLNPRARGQSGFISNAELAPAVASPPMSPGLAGSLQRQQQRTVSTNKKVG